MKRPLPRRELLRQAEALRVKTFAELNPGFVHSKKAIPKKRRDALEREARR